jgi:hypothetical protein
MKKHTDLNMEDFDDNGFQYIYGEVSTTDILNAVEEALIPFGLELEVALIDNEIKGVKVVNG